MKRLHLRPLSLAGKTRLFIPLSNTANSAIVSIHFPNDEAAEKESLLMFSQTAAAVIVLSPNTNLVATGILSWDLYNLNVDN
ncbi:MAG: hypothetical protein AB1345_14960 [Chloroflexota bacterium]